MRDRTLFCGQENSSISVTTVFTFTGNLLKRQFSTLHYPYRCFSESLQDTIHLVNFFLCLSGHRTDFVRLLADRGRLYRSSTAQRAYIFSPRSYTASSTRESEKFRTARRTQNARINHDKQNNCMVNMLAVEYNYSLHHASNTRNPLQQTTIRQ
jgi:hypothetical protein